MDATAVAVEGLRSVKFMVLAALEGFMLVLLASLLWAGKLDGDQFVTSFKYGSAVVGLLGLVASGRAIRGWIRSVVKSASRTFGG